MPLLGSRSGFRNFRDLALFFIGIAIIIYEFAILPPDKLNPTALVFAGGLVGTPYILNRDEKRTDSEPAHVIVTSTVRSPPLSRKRAPAKKVGAKKVVARKTTKKTAAKKQAKRRR